MSSDACGASFWNLYSFVNLNLYDDIVYLVKIAVYATHVSGFVSVEVYGA